MKESDIYRALKKVWPYYIERIEDKLKGGIPDVMVEKNGAGVAFLELKLFTVTETGKVKIKIRPSQYIWFKSYTGIAHMICWDGVEYYVFNKWRVPSIKNGMDWEEFKSIYLVKNNNIKFISEFIKQSISFS